MLAPPRASSYLCVKDIANLDALLIHKGCGIVSAVMHDLDHCAVLNDSTQVLHDA